MSMRDEADRAETLRATNTMQRMCAEVRVPEAAIAQSVRDAENVVLSPGSLQIMAEQILKNRVAHVVERAASLVMEKRMTEIAETLSREFGVTKESVMECLTRERW